MIRKILIIIYSLIILVFAGASSFITWANNPIMILFVEILVDTVLLLGIVLSLCDKHIKWWFIPFVLAVIGEVYLLVADDRIGIKEAIQWTLILVPAIYLHLRVIGFVGDRKMKSETV